MSARNVVFPVSHNGDHSPIHLAPVTDWSAMGRSEHFVQFYEEDRFLIQSVASFIGAGFREGEAAIVIATKAHRDALDGRLRQEGLDPDELRASGQFHALDAAETLAKFMSAGSPDPRLFVQTVGSLVARVIGQNRPLRAFGEMVALLWQEGNSEGAIRLEELWNELGKKYCFSLFCAYPMGGFCGDSHGQPFAHICSAHTRVIPAESYSGNTNGDDRLRSITVLQQKAASLEAEIIRRKQIEKELAQQKRELSDFLQNASEGIHQVSAEGTILWANSAELQLLGYSAEEYIGHDIRQFHADAPVIADILEKLGRGEEVRDCEARLKHKDGSIRYVSLNSNVCWDGDKFRYSRCFTRDITDRKRAAEILEQTVAERTAQLRETVAELEAFSYSISHDMRSPLRAMHGYARTLLLDYGPTFPADAVQSLERIQRGATRLDMLIRDILAYSKVAKDQIELKPVPLDRLIADLMEQHPELQQARDRISIRAPLHNVLGHEAYLTQCLSNLIENGLKFVAPGTTPQVWLRSELQSGKIRVSITDNGVGIAPEHYNRIFQIFGRVYPEKRYSGTGIGLAVVKKAVARMGGDAGFQSEPGKAVLSGSLSLTPMAISQAILLVEDNEDDIFLMRRALKEANVANPLSVVEDGQEAVDYLSGAGKFSDRSAFPLPALIFLDLKLPLKSGHDVLAWIRKQAALASTVVVVLTSSDEPGDVQKSYSLGANSYLVKPPTSEQLMDMAKSFKWYWLEYNRFGNAPSSTVKPS